MKSDIEKQRQHFEGVSETYYTARRDANHLKLKELLWRYVFARHRNIVPDSSSVLEAMCGYGEGREILSRNFNVSFTYSGFDYSPSLVEKARQTMPGVRIEVADAVSYTSDETYDVVILIGGLHHVFAHADKVLRKLHAALKPGGHFINFEPTQDNFIFRRIRERIYLKNELFDESTERAFDLESLNSMYANAGLVLKDQIYPGLLAYVLYYNPDAFPSLNIGSEKAVRAVFSIESRMYRHYIARKLSFATLSILQRPMK